MSEKITRERALELYDIRLVNAIDKWKAEGFTVKEVCEDLFITDGHVSLHVAFHIEFVAVKLVAPVCDRWEIHSCDEVDEPDQAIVAKIQEFMDRGRAADMDASSE